MKVVAEVCKTYFNLVNLLLRKHSKAQLCEINATTYVHVLQPGEWSDCYHHHCLSATQRLSQGACLLSVTVLCSWKSYISPG